MISRVGEGKDTAMMSSFEYWRARGELMREKLSSDLIKAIEERDAYANLASVCAWCRKIKGSDSNWLTLETYLAQNDRMVSHSICPECSERELERT